MNMDDIFERDREGLETLMEKEIVCWSEVSRLGHTADNQGYMVIELPLMQQYKVSGGERGFIFPDEADADNVNPYLLGLHGRRVPFVILSIDEDKNGHKYLNCSRKKAQQILKASMLQNLQNGNVYEGVLTGFSRYGGYIEVNGVTGHIRNSDFADDHSDIREYLSVKDKVEVRCKEISPEGYIFWEVLTKMHRTKPIVHDFEVDTVVLGRVARISDFERGVGVFVNLSLGIDALCSLPRDLEVEEGARVSVKIESINSGRKPTDAPRIRGRIVRVI